MDTKEKLINAIIDKGAALHRMGYRSAGLNHFAKVSEGKEQLREAELVALLQYDLIFVEELRYSQLASKLLEELKDN